MVLNVYRGSSFSGPWTKIGTVAEGSSVLDMTQPAGVTDYYLTELDAVGSESAPSAFTDTANGA